MVDAQTLTLSADALHVPEQIEVDVEEKEEGFQLFAGDITLPEGSELVTDAELLVVAVTIPRVEEEDTEDEDAEGTEGAEGEQSEDAEGENSEESSEQE